MAHRTFWLYQRRDNPVPWAICIEKEWDRRKPRDALLSATIYSELIDNPMHSVYISGMKHDEIADYAEEIAAAIGRFDEVTLDDKRYLEVSILDILADNSLYNKR